MGLKIEDVPVTVTVMCFWIRNNWYGYSQIQSGMAHCIIAGGAESMSFIPMGG
jgi:acetyl-CoA acyltransferase